MIKILLLALIVLVGGLCQGSTKRAIADPYQDASAERSYNALSVDDRIRLQVMLIAVGHLDAVPNVSFNQRTLAAIRQYQRSYGGHETGVLNDAQIKALEVGADRMMRLWGFRKVRHPRTGHPLWIPTGLAFEQEQHDSGITFSRKGVAVIRFRTLANRDISSAYSGALQPFRGDGQVIEYQVKRRDFFAISTSYPKRGTKHYQRYERVASGIVGFEFYWNTAHEDYKFERVAALMSASLWSSTTGAPFIDPPQIFDALTEDATQQHDVSPATTSSGTGLFVSRDGYILTNAHVVEGCEAVIVTESTGIRTEARVTARDVVNDLALLKADFTPNEIATFRSGVRLGEGIAAFGFPLTSVLASSGNFTLGNVTALAGLGDDSRYMQISAPVQPGNSGGPLFDMAGNVVGVVSAKLNALRIMVATSGDIPQNVNFAIKEAMATNFLESNRVKFNVGRSGLQMEPADVADRARDVSVFIQCSG